MGLVKIFNAKKIAAFISAVIMSAAVTADAFRTEAYNYWDNGYGYTAEPFDSSAFGDMRIEDGNSLSRAMNEAIAASEETAGEAMPVSIHDAVVSRENNTVTVDYSSITGATIVVALYDDECTQMLTSGKTEIGYSESGTVTVFMEYLPQYFYLKAYAVSDISAEPLSGVYEDHYYTKEWQDFFSKTVYDFPAEQVINFDSNPAKNFAALYSDTANVMSDGIHNVVVSADYDNMIFVIENPDEKITGLAAGQKAVIWGTVGEFIITRVSRLDVTEDGSIATVYGETAAPEDVFEHFNYDMSTEGQEFTYEPHENEIVSVDIPDEDLAEIERLLDEYQAQGADPSPAMFYSSRAPSFSYDPKTDTFKITIGEKKYTVKIKKGDDVKEDDANGKKRKFEVVEVDADKLTFKLDTSGSYKNNDVDNIDFEISGEMTGKVEIDPDFEVRYYMSSTMAEAKLVTNIGIGLEYHANGEIEFTALLFTLPSMSVDSLGIVNINGGDVKYHAKATAEVNLNRSYNVIITLGAYKESLHVAKLIKDMKIDKSDKDPLDINIEIIGGIIFEPYVSITKNKDLASLAVPIEFDVEMIFDCHKNLDGKPLDTDSMKHECTSCASLDVSFKAKLIVTCTLLGETKTLGNIFDKTIGNPVEVYWSDKNNNRIKEGKCPYKTYKVTFKVQTVNDKGGKPLYHEGATVTYTYIETEEEEEEEVKTDVKGEAVVYLKKGTYTYTVKDKDGKLMKRKHKGINGYRGEFTVGEKSVNEAVKVFNNANNASARMSYGYSAYSMSGYSAQRAAEGVIPADINDMAVVVSVLSGAGKIRQFESCNRTYGAVTENGDLYMWGQNSYGQLGNGTTTSSSTPIYVMSNVSRLYLFGTTSAAVTKDGKFYSWGEKTVGVNLDETDLNKQIQVEKCLKPEIVPIPGKVVSAFVSDKCNAVVTADGSVYMWGRIPFVDENIKEEQFVYFPGGVGEFKISISVTCYSEPTRIDIGSNFKYVYSDGENLALVTETGEVYGCSYYWYDGSTWSKYFTRVFDNIGNVETIYFRNYNNDDLIIITKDGRMYGIKEAVQENTQLIMSDVASYARTNLGYMVLTKDGKILYWDSANYSGENIMTYNYVDNPISITGFSSESMLGILTADGKIYIAYGDITPPEQIELTKENSEEAAPALYSFPPQDMQYYGFYAAAQPETKAFSGLIPNAAYNFYVMKDRAADDPYSADNLLYIEQKTSDAGGNLTFVYIPAMTAADTNAFVETAERIDFTGSEFYAYNIEYDGEEHFADTRVILNGKELQIGRDYALCGNYSVTAPGTYELIFLGQGMYKGAVSVTFDVYTGSYVPEPIPGEPLKSVTVNGVPISVGKNMTYEIPYSDWIGGNIFTVNAEPGDGYTAAAEPSSFTANSADFVQTVTITVSDGTADDIYILTVTASGCSHSYESYFSDGNGHWRECLKCGNEERGEHDSARSEITVPPAEYSEGLRTYYCSVCGYAVRTEPIPAAGGSGSHASPQDPAPSVALAISGEKREPFLRNDSGVKGWNAIYEVLSDAEEGSAVHINMNGTDELPKKALTKIKGKDIDLILDMGKGIVWTVNGYSVTKPKTADMGVNKNSRKIPAEAINGIDGKKYTVQISLDNKNSFGFTAIMAIDLDAEYNGLYANLFYYDPKAKELVFADCDLVEGGKADIKFMLGSNYAVIISEKPLGEYEDVSSAAGISQLKEQLVMETVAYPLCILVIIIGGIAVIAVKKKS